MVAIKNPDSDIILMFYSTPNISGFRDPLGLSFREYFQPTITYSKLTIEAPEL